MAKRVKPAKKAAIRIPKVASGELLTLLDFLRYAVSRFNEAKLAFAHGTTDPVAGMIADWTGMIITAYVGGRSIEKVARIFARRS